MLTKKKKLKGTHTHTHAREHTHTPGCPPSGPGLGCPRPPHPWTPQVSLHSATLLPTIGPVPVAAEASRARLPVGTDERAPLASRTEGTNTWSPPGGHLTLHSHRPAFSVCPSIPTTEFPYDDTGSNQSAWSGRCNSCGQFSAGAQLTLVLCIGSGKFCFGTLLKESNK